jgi:hypothetical protein
MKKKTDTPPSGTNRLITAGIIMLLTTPIIQSVFIAIAQLGCPLVGGQRDCEFEYGLQIAVFANALPWVWLIASAILIIAGMASNRSPKNSS